MHYDKRPISIDEQLYAWEAGQVVCQDRVKALSYLSNISAYRLKPYKRCLTEKAGDGQAIDFEQIIRLYVFDKKIRLLFFDAIERIEVAVRAQFINCFGVRYGDHWHLDPRFFSNLSAFDAFTKEVSDVSDPRKRPDSLKHYFEKYADGPASPPCSMLMEAMSFGQVSRLFKGLDDNEGKKDIAQHFGVKVPVLANWLHSLSYLRNACAHHARVWNHAASIAPKQPDKPTDKWLDISQINPKKIYLSFVVVCYLLRRISPSSTFQQRFLQLISDESNAMHYREMGFPYNWNQDGFWQ